MMSPKSSSWDADGTDRWLISNLCFSHEKLCINFRHTQQQLPGKTYVTGDFPSLTYALQFSCHALSDVVWYFVLLYRVSVVFRFTVIAVYYIHYWSRTYPIAKMSPVAIFVISGLRHLLMVNSCDGVSPAQRKAMAWIIVYLRTTLTFFSSWMPWEIKKI